jgi:hypothetical protein
VVGLQPLIANSPVQATLDGLHSMATQLTAVQANVLTVQAVPLGQKCTRRSQALDRQLSRAASVVDTQELDDYEVPDAWMFAGTWRTGLTKQDMGPTAPGLRFGKNCMGTDGTDDLYSLCLTSLAGLPNHRVGHTIVVIRRRER